MADEFLVRTVQELARVASSVPLGKDTLIEPDDPVLIQYVQHELRPRFIEVGAYDIVDLPMNQFAVRFGDGDGPCLALMAYSPTQHHNLMAEPLSGQIRTPIELGIDEPCVFGQGMTQNKAHQACLLSLARSLARDSEPIKGTLYLCINNEGRSSHDCSYAILDSLPVQPDLVVQLMNTAFDITVGNRGRIDVYVHVRGESVHSSSAMAKGRVIETVAQVLRRVEELNESVKADPHPVLGMTHVVPYQVVFEPLAPHTLPDYAKITLDRRLVPGVDGTEATAEIERALSGLEASGCTIEVEAGVMMLPALFPDTARPLLGALEDSIRQVFREEPRRTIYGGTFDAGGPLARGVPTVMFGIPDEGGLLGDDFVRLSALSAQDEVLRETTARFFASAGS